MEPETNRIQPGVQGLADEGQALLESTAETTEKTIDQARKRLAAALNSAKEAYGCLEAKASEGAKAADKVVRAHPYQAIGAAFGVGVVMGFLMCRRS